MVIFFFKQKTAYEMRISDWSSDVCSSDLKYEDAIVKFRQALTLDPTFARPMMRWGDALANQGRYEDAIGRYQKTLEIDSRYPAALVGWADSLIALGRDDEPRLQYAAAVATDPTFPRIPFASGRDPPAHGDR